MKHNFSILLLCCLFSSACKTVQKLPVRQITNGEVNYSISFDTANGEIAPPQFGTEARVLFNKDYLKFTKNAGQAGFEYQFIHLNTKEDWSYLNFMNKKFKVLIESGEILKAGTPTLHDEFKLIQGFKCQKLTAPMGDGELIAYITNEIQINYCPYLNTDGFALEYTLNLPFGKPTYSATEFKEKEMVALQPDDSYKAFNSMREMQLWLTNATDDIVGSKIDFSFLVDIKGNTINNETIGEQISVINFWFAACAPCITEIPDLNLLKEKYPAVQFMAVTFDPKKEVQSFLEKHPFNFRLFSDSNKFIKNQNINIFPTTIIINKKGIVTAVESGGSFSIFDKLSEHIETALNNN